jgi:ABC-2 type transport system permease protein
MIGCFRAELLKLRKRWAIYILALIFVLIVVLLDYVLSYIILKNPPSGAPVAKAGGPTVAQQIASLYPANFHRDALSSVGSLGSAIAIILGVLVFGSEYGWGTLKTIFTQKSSRLTVFGGQFLGLTLVTFIFTILLMVSAAASSFGLALIDGVSPQWPDVITIIGAAGAIWLILEMWTLFGVMLSVLFQQSAMAMGIGLVYGFVVEGLIFGLFGSNATLQNFEKFFPGANVTGLVAAFGQSVSARAVQPVLMGTVEALLVLVAFVAIFLAISAGATNRRDYT